MATVKKHKSDDKDIKIAFVAGGNVKLYNYCRKQYSSSLKKLKRKLQYDSAILLLVVYISK